MCPSHDVITGPLWGESTGEQWWEALMFSVSILNSLLNKQLRGLWFLTPRCVCYANVMITLKKVTQRLVNKLVFIKTSGNVKNISRRYMLCVPKGIKVCIILHLYPSPSFAGTPIRSQIQYLSRSAWISTDACRRMEIIVYLDDNFPDVCYSGSSIVSCDVFVPSRWHKPLP